HASDFSDGEVKVELFCIRFGSIEKRTTTCKAKLYRFDKEGNQWKERGAGSVKFLKHKKTEKVRLVMRQSKTLKICANHLVLPTMSVQEHAGNEKSCVWHASDFSDGEVKVELFCIRFGSIEISTTLYPFMPYSAHDHKYNADHSSLSF
nr:Ran-binding protein 1 homolog a-like [Tanacetum cinerariifolium]